MAYAIPREGDGYNPIFYEEAGRTVCKNLRRVRVVYEYALRYNGLIFWLHELLYPLWLYGSNEQCAA